MKKATKDWIIIIAYIISIYASVSSIVYTFEHPDMTRTQLFLHTFDALLWRG